MNWDEHLKNRGQFPAEELAAYQGQHVAWSLDGTRILAGDQDPSKLTTKLKAAGYTSNDFILSFIDSDACGEGSSLTDSEWERIE